MVAQLPGESLRLAAGDAVLNTDGSVLGPGMFKEKLQFKESSLTVGQRPV